MNDPMNKFVIGKAQTELREFQSAGDAWAAAKAASATAPAKKPASTLVKTPSGNMIMDDKTAALKVVSDVSRKDPGLETRNLLDKLKDLLNEYLTTIPSGIQLWSEDKCHLPNMTSLSNCLYEATTEGFKPSLDLVAQVHRELEKNSRIFRNRHVVDAAGFYDGALHLQPGEAAPRV